jgi:two-component system, LytTR family, response regulator LytT
MKNCLIIEDEILAAERLTLMLKQYDPSIRVMAVLDSVDESVSWFRKNLPPDFILMDIQLADGSAFEIFKQIKIDRPIIFTTAFDQFALEAFKVLSIDYLLKPVTVQVLTAALDKLKILNVRPVSSSIDYDRMMQMLDKFSKYKNRYVGRLGSKQHFIDAREISFFEADNKIVYLVRMDGNRYLVDQTLEELEKTLDPALFFRINRSVIIHIGSLAQVKPYLNSRLIAMLKTGGKFEEIIISRERVNEFKQWADS